MNAEEQMYDELLGAYALDAVDTGERRAIEEYVSMNPRAAAEVRDHREVAAMLSWTTISAPDHLWDRIAASIDDEAVADVPPLSAVVSFQGAVERRRRRWTASLGWVAAAAAACVAVVMSVAALSDTDRGGEPLAVGFERALADRDSRTATLVNDASAASARAVIDADGHGYIDASALPPLSADKAYQLWGVVDDKVISLGVFGAKPEIETFTVEGPVSALAVTIEVAGGVVSDGNPAGAFVGELS